MADPTAELIDRLLASDKLSSDTRSELGECKQELQNGKLDGADRRYVEALGQRLLGVRAPANDDGGFAGEAEEGSEVLDDNLWDLGEDEELQGWRERAEKAELRVAELEAEVAALKTRLGEGGEPTV